MFHNGLKGGLAAGAIHRVPFLSGHARPHAPAAGIRTPLGAEQVLERRPAVQGKWVDNSPDFNRVIGVHQRTAHGNAWTRTFCSIPRSSARLGTGSFPLAAAAAQASAQRLRRAITPRDRRLEEHRPRRDGNRSGPSLPISEPFCSEPSVPQPKAAAASAHSRPRPDLANSRGRMFGRCCGDAGRCAVRLRNSYSAAGSPILWRSPHRPSGGRTSKIVYPEFIRPVGV